MLPPRVPEWNQEPQRGMQSKATQKEDGQATQHGREKGGRIHALDHLRAVAMLLGIVLHGVIAHQTTVSYVWPIQDPSRHVLADWIYHIIHSFRMPLFFILSGYLSRGVFYRVGAEEFMKRRWSRLGVPLLIGIFTLSPINEAMQSYGDSIAGPPSMELDNLDQWMEREKLSSKRPIEMGEPTGRHSMWFYLKRSFSKIWKNTQLGHMWFLYYLIFFFLTIPRMASWVEKKLGKEWFQRLDDFNRVSIRSRWIGLPLAILIFPILFVQFNVYNWGLGTPLSIFLPFPFFLIGCLELNMVLIYGMFFSAGWILDRHPNALMTMSDRYRFNLFLGCIGALISFGLEQKFLLQVDHPFRWLAKSAALFIYAWGSVSLSLGLIGFFIKKFPRENKIWRYISDASYWIYLAHLPVVFFLQAKLAPFPWPWYFKLLVTCMVTFAILTATYQIAVRHTIIGRILSGKKRNPRKESFLIDKAKES